MKEEFCLPELGFLFLVRQGHVVATRADLFIVSVLTRLLCCNDPKNSHKSENHIKNFQSKKTLSEIYDRYSTRESRVLTFQLVKVASFELKWDV